MKRQNHHKSFTPNPNSTTIPTGMGRVACLHFMDYSHAWTYRGRTSGSVSSFPERRQRTWRQNMHPPYHQYRRAPYLDQLICMLVPSFPLPTWQGRDPIRHPRDRISPHLPLKINTHPQPPPSPLPTPGEEGKKPSQQNHPSSIITTTPRPRTHSSPPPHKMLLTPLLVLVLFPLPPTLATPHLLLPAVDFPDPSLLHDPLTNTWHAFATASGPLPLQAASAPFPLGPWTHHANLSLLESPPPWTTGANAWAPSVHRLPGKDAYILYFSGQHKEQTALHCIGTAVSRTGPLGPYTPDAEPFECPLSRGGAIDPTSFVDRRTGDRWVAWKVDGNAVGHGGYCGNSVPPVVQTPIEMVRVSPRDGTTRVGGAVRVWDREEGVDGPLVEAPGFWDTGVGGRWVLFFSNGCWDSEGYTVSWAVSTSDGGVEGGFRRGGVLVGSGMGGGLRAPGGAEVVGGGEGRAWMVFHADCEVGRCLFGGRVGWVEGEVKFVGDDG